MKTSLQLVLVICGMLCLSTLAQEIQQELGVKAVDGDLSAVDRRFDDSILSTEGRPPLEKVPSHGEVERLYKAQRSRIIADAQRSSSAEGAKARTEVVDVNLYARYYSQSNWNVVLRCCPRSQNYGCRAVSKPLPCFRHLINGQYQWCCPFWPRIQVSYCNCHKCAILSSCATTGYCRRRYQWSTIYAVCYGQPWWTIRRLRKSLPVGCYCRAKAGC